jgi:hypothetical protein
MNNLFFNEKGDITTTFQKKKEMASTDVILGINSAAKI